MIRATVTSKGQITLPKTVRDALGLQKSAVVVFEVREGEAILRPAGRGFMSRFASVPPSARPEDWGQVREKTQEQIGREAAEELE